MNTDKHREIKRMYNYLIDNHSRPFDDDYRSVEGWSYISWHHRSSAYKIAKEHYKSESYSTDLNLAINCHTAEMKWVKNHSSINYGIDKSIERDINTPLSFSIIEDCIHSFLLEEMKKVAQKKAIEIITQKEIRRVLDGHYEALKLLKV